MDGVIETLVAAIGAREPLTLRRDDDPPGAERTGEPHAIFASADGTPFLAFYQVAGHSGSSGLPGWRNIPLERITAAARAGGTFVPQPSFNARSPLYHRVMFAVSG